MTRLRTLWGSGALQLGDLRLLEDGGERGGTLISDLVVPQTVSEEQSGDGVKEQACQWALTRNLGAGFRAPGGLLERLQRGVALEALGESSCSFGTKVVHRETASMGAGPGAESVNGH